MAPTKTQYIIVPANGLEVAENDPQQGQFFESLYQTFTSASKVHSVTTQSGLLPVKVLDSIGEKKAKLVECFPDDLPALRASHPSVRILPVVYYQPAVVRYRVAVNVTSLPVRAKSVKATAVARTARKAVAAKAPAAGPAISIAIVSSIDGKPVAKALVSAFTNFANGIGAGGTTNSKGQVALALGAASKKIERSTLIRPRHTGPSCRRTSHSSPA